jgi:tetratricopeptide (TPR) repeat protein
VCIYVIAAIIFSVSPVRGELVNFHADLECDGCTSYSNLVMELRDSGKNHSNAVPVSVGGSAEFQSIPEGSYLLTVRDMRGESIHQEMVVVRKHAGPVSIRLPEKKVERPVSGLVSVARLKHKIPKAARKAFSRSIDLHKKGDAEGSLSYLKKATEVDPEYMEAFNNLGARYLSMGRYHEALSAFRRAMDLDPSATLVQVNAGVALMALGNLKEAETAFRRVVQLTGEVKARYMLGLALYAQQQYTEEAVHLLNQAQNDYPSARLALAVIHANLGHTKEARKALDAYMPTAPEKGRLEAQALLAHLQQNE